MNDYLDSRDLEEELKELEEQEDKDEIDQRRLKSLKELKSECENYGWEYGICFIPTHMFQDYAREVAEDVGYISDENNPLLNCVDWEQWADMLEMDYSEVDFEGDSYLWMGA